MSETSNKSQPNSSRSLSPFEFKPQTPLIKTKSNVDKKFKILKHDLQQLDKISSFHRHLSSKKPTQESIVTKKIDLNTDFDENKAKNSIKPSLFTKSELVRPKTIKNPPVKYETKHLNQKEMSKAPLNVVLKGKPIIALAQNQNDTENDTYENDLFKNENDEEDESENEDEHDEGIEDVLEDDKPREENENEDNIEEFFNDEEFYYHATLNTPVTMRNSSEFEQQQDYDKSKLIAQIKNAYINEIKNYMASKPKPAILNSVGTLGQVKMSERPKPAKKEKTLNSQRSPRVKNRLITELKEMDNLSESERQQLELEIEMKSLIDDAKSITKLPTSKLKRISRPYEVVSDDKVADLLDIERRNLISAAPSSTVSTQKQNEKLLLKSVETLITAIKSGELVKQQDESDKKIQEILSTILDEKSMLILDPSFRQRQENLDEEEKQNEEDLKNIIEESHLSSFKLTPNEQELEQLETDEYKELKQSRLTNEQQKDSRLLSSSAYVDVKSQTKSDIYYEQGQTSRLNKTSTLSYEEEVELYLASLPREVTREDILNTTATQVKLQNRPEPQRREHLIDLSKFQKKSVKELTTEERFARNLHLFCMLEHERRQVLLLPDELINVTRKYHTRNRYDLKRKSRHDLSSSQTRESLISSLSFKSKEASFVINPLKQSSKITSSVMSNLNEISIANTAKQSQMDIDTKSLPDSGVGDENLDTWRLQAEIELTKTFGLEVKKAKLNSIESMREFALTFLRPAPPKMSLRRSQIKKNLFPEYKSVPPPIDDEHQQNIGSKKSSRGQAKLTLMEIRKNLLHIDDEDLMCDSELEMQFILEKVLNRQYNSETDLSKFKKDNEPVFDDSTQIDPDSDEFIFDKISNQPLLRAFSDTRLNRKNLGDQKDFQFLKIDSNYNDALEETSNQRAKLKEIFLRKKTLESMSNVSKKAESVLLDTKKSEEFNNDNKLTNKDSLDGKRVYFPKNNKKTLAEIALEEGRKYVMNPIKKKRNKLSIGKRLDSDLLDRIEADIMDKNVRSLKRCESLDKIRFPKRNKEIDECLDIPDRIYIARHRLSISNLMTFDKYKKKFNYDQSRWHTNKDDYYDNEREWVREIWNVWFDEVIPQLDGTGGRKSSDGKKESQQQSSGVKEQEQEEDDDDDEEDGDNASTAMDDQSATNNNSKLNLSSSVSIRHLPTVKQLAGQTDSTEEQLKTLNVKSPTPYFLFDRIELDQTTDINALKTLEKEVEVLTKRIESKPSAFDFGRRGTLYRKLGFIKLALDDLNKAIEMEERYVDAYWQRHLIYLLQDFKDQALEDLNIILKMNRTHSGAYLSRGDLYAERKDYALAIVNYSQSIKYNANDYKAYFKRAKMYELSGDKLMAMDDYLTTTKLNPKVYDAWFKHGMSYFENKNWHYAIFDFTELIKHNPDNQAKARLYRAKCYMELNDFQQAFDDFSVALHLNPNDWESYYYRGCLLRRINPKQAIQDFSISLLLESGYDNLNCYLHRGILYTEQNLYDEAIKDFQSVLQLDKEFAPAYVNLGIIYMNLTMNYWLAIKNFNLAIKSNPVYIRAYLCRAQAYRCIHDLKQAYLDYTKAIHLDPMDPKIYIYRGQVIYEMGDLKLAAFCVQHAAFLNENNNRKVATDSLEESSLNMRVLSGTNKNRRHKENRVLPISQQSFHTQNTSVNSSITQQSLVYSFLKNYNKAIEILDHEIKLKPSSELFNLLGRVFMKAKRWQDAIIAFDKSIELNSEETKSVNRSVMNMSTFSQHMNKGTKKDLIDSYFMKGQCLVELNKYQEAYHAFDKVIELKPDFAKAYFNRGLTRVHLKHAKCIQDFNKALAIEPTLFEAFLARACIYSMQNRFSKAILNCNQAIKLNPISVRGFLYRGALRYFSKLYEYGVEDLTDAIKLDQTCALAYYNRALCYHKLKDYRNALKDYGVVILLGDYLRFKVLINRALLYFETKQYFNALIDFKLASEFQPKDFNIKHMIGVCLHRLDRYQEAIALLSEAYELNPNFHDALISRGNVFVDYGTPEAFKKAQLNYERVLTQNYKNVDAHINLAYLFQITGRFKMAWNQFSKAIEFDSRCMPLYEGRSVVCLQMSDTNAALKDINKALSIKKNAELFVNRGVIYQFMADNLNAMRDYQSAILLDPKYGLAYYNSANIYLLHKQFEQAVKNFDVAIEKCELKDECTYQNRAIAKAFTGDTSGAFRDLCEALKYGKYSAHIYMNRALLLFNKENFSLAEKDLTTAIDFSPNDALLYKLRGDCRAKLSRNEEAISDYKLSIELQHRKELVKEYNSKK